IQGRSPSWELRLEILDQQHGLSIMADHRPVMTGRRRGVSDLDHPVRSEVEQKYLLVPILVLSGNEVGVRREHHAVPIARELRLQDKLVLRRTSNVCKLGVTAVFSVIEKDLEDMIRVLSWNEIPVAQNRHPLTIGADARRDRENSRWGHRLDALRSPVNAHHMADGRAV